jgi:hypothetical protein
MFMHEEAAPAVPYNTNQAEATLPHRESIEAAAKEAP